MNVLGVRSIDLCDRPIVMRVRQIVSDMMSEL